MNNDKDFDTFVNEFNLIDNALDMRTLRRWNGRDLRDEENLAEHTHLVVCCLYELIDSMKYEDGMHFNPPGVDNMVRNILCHDALELLRGDILSITKNVFQGLRKQCDDEEEEFMLRVCPILTDEQKRLIKLADLMACYKFVEWELRYPSNEFAKSVYISTKKIFQEALNYFCEDHEIMSSYQEQCNAEPDNRFAKGYIEDAGVDILLDKDVVFMPMSTTSVELNVQITPKENEMSFLCARTSAANKGLSVATCPIDANYSGNVSAIVHNMSNTPITYKKGEAFCQYVTCQIIVNRDVKCKKEGKRTISKFGGTDVNNT